MHALHDVSSVHLAGKIFTCDAGGAEQIRCGACVVRALPVQTVTARAACTST